MAQAQFKWSNLPVEIKDFLIERYLFYYGTCVFFRDNILGRYLILPLGTVTQWDENQLPVSYTCIGFMGYTVNLNVNNSVIIYNDNQQTQGFINADIFAGRLTNALRTADMHLEAKKIGKIITATENTAKGIKAILKRISNFNLYTITSSAGKNLNDNITVLDTEIDTAIKDFDNHYSFLWHDTLSYYGIESMSDKLSGVNPEEVKAENSMASINKACLLNARQRAVKEINEMFDLNISVEPYKAGDDNGTIYNDPENSNGSINR